MTVRYINDSVKSMTNMHERINSQLCLNALPDIQDVKSSFNTSDPAEVLQS